MKKSTKAALLSALVCPGVGQFWLKKPISGSLFLISFIIGLAFVIQNISQKTQYVLTKIQQGDIALSIPAIEQALNSAPSNLSMAALSNLTSYLLVIWLVATLHAYWFGKKGEKTH